jgi:carbamoyltransferase
MAMAGYGDSTRYFDKIMDDIRLIDDGTFDIPLLRRDTNVEEMETHSGVIRYLSNRFGPARLPGEEILQRHFDLAAGIQAVLETCLLHVVREFSRETGMDRLCLAGGVALNCKANGLLRRSHLFRSMFIQPAAGDDGSALGAAIFAQATREPECQFAPMDLPLWGPEECDVEILAALDSVNGIDVEAHPDTASVIKAVARRLAAGEIIAWHQGRMEFGPRSLGNRSILADPQRASMRDRINGVIKQREEFRPFAPSVMAERATEFFDIAKVELTFLRYMIVTAQVRDRYRSQLAAVTHVDGSARLQVVDRRDMPLYWSLLSEFNELTGIPVLLNTSLNVDGSPISRSVSDSLRTLLTSQLDALYVGRFAVRRSPARL